MEIVLYILVGIITLEGLYACYKLYERNKLIKDDLTQKLIERAKENERTARRDVNGTFGNPLADKYRKNEKGQYVPIRPNSKMIDGDEDDDV